MAAVGGGAGIVLAGPIVKSLNYHWLFWFPLAISLSAAVMAHFFVPESPVRTPGRINWIGAMLLSGWLGPCSSASVKHPRGDGGRRKSSD